MGEHEFFVGTTAVLVMLGVGVQLWFASGAFLVATSLFLSVGAFVSSYATVELGWGLVPAAGLALAAGFASCVLLAPLFIRLNGIYLAMASLAASEVIRIAGLNVEWLTGGAAGRIVPQRLEWLDLVFIAGACLLGSWYLQRGRRGLQLELLRHDRRVASAVGVDVRRRELACFVAGGLVSTLAGVSLAHLVRFISPQEFGLGYAIDALAICIIGGRRHWFGPVLGAAVVAGVPHVFGLSTTWSEILAGSLLIGTLLLAPDGLADAAADAVHARRRGATRVPPAVDGVPRPPATDAPRELGAPVLAVEGVALRYGGVEALVDVSFAARAGEIVGIVGPNGAGKTSLINVCTGLARPVAGTVRVDGQPLSSVRRAAVLGVRRTFQHVQLADRLSIASNVALGSLLRVDRGAGRHGAADVLATVGLGGLAANRPREVPLGRRRLAELGRVVAAQPTVAFLDEPSSGCDEGSVDRMRDVIHDLARDGCAVLVVSHDIRFVTEVADRVLLMANGRLVKDLPASELVSDATARELYLGGARA